MDSQLGEESPSGHKSLEDIIIATNDKINLDVNNYDYFNYQREEPLPQREEKSNAHVGDSLVNQTQFSQTETHNGRVNPLGGDPFKAELGGDAGEEAKEVAAKDVEAKEVAAKDVEAKDVAAKDVEAKEKKDAKKHDDVMNMEEVKVGEGPENVEGAKEVEETCTVAGAVVVGEGVNAQEGTPGSSDTGDTGGNGDTGDTGGNGYTGDTGGNGDTGDTGDTGGNGDTGDTGGNGDTGNGATDCAGHIGYACPGEAYGIKNEDLTKGEKKKERAKETYKSKLFRLFRRRDAPNCASNEEGGGGNGGEDGCELTVERANDLIVEHTDERADERADERSDERADKHGDERGEGIPEDALKQDEHLILDVQSEHAVEMTFAKSRSEENSDKSTANEKKESSDSTVKKVYSLEKLKSFVSNNTFFREKKSLLMQKKSKISKDVNFFCSNYNMFLCFILYILCFSFVLSSLCCDIWKIHEMELQSNNKTKSVQIVIGATTIRRIQKVSNMNGDVTLSIDKEQKMDSLINNMYCKKVKKDELESFLLHLAASGKLKIPHEMKEGKDKETLNDDELINAFTNPGDVGLLRDEKLILTRKYIFGSTIYNLECKFLEKIKKAGTFHKILLYAILLFLFVSICLLSHILLKYKSSKNIQKLKYISFVLVNLALITLISSVFSINREYNIPLCVQRDGSSDICLDGKSIHLIRASILLIIFSNLFFCKFVNIARTKGSTIDGSIV
ncbi:conserved Plasmodium protein, unknown function [Plasmodium ovale wallikeri]|uniref:Uncharacterized protein n=1 Tax=Plasmodium ovale wallikeri TaxID=864142 RepID=A0A1A8Z588_PLAOA|nr:conserved Plasmodium protein, unknown function [Plasmodium ovale wallikeri]